MRSRAELAKPPPVAEAMETEERERAAETAELRQRQAAEVQRCARGRRARGRAHLELDAGAPEIKSLEA